MRKLIILLITLIFNLVTCLTIHGQSLEKESTFREVETFSEVLILENTYLKISIDDFYHSLSKSYDKTITQKSYNNNPFHYIIQNDHSFYRFIYNEEEMYLLVESNKAYNYLKVFSDSVNHPTTLSIGRVKITLNNNDEFIIVNFGETNGFEVNDMFDISINIE